MHNASPSIADSTSPSVDLKTAEPDTPHPLHPSVFGFLSVALGAIAGAGAFVFRGDTAATFELLVRLQFEQAELAVIMTRPDHAGAPSVRGVVHKHQVTEALAEGMQLFQD